MSDNLIIEQNTIYEFDEECLRNKENCMMRGVFNSDVRSTNYKNTSNSFLLAILILFLVQ